MNVEGLERSVKSYLFSSQARGRRHALRSIVLNAAAALPETVIFGGMLRDFALGAVRSFSSDIDFVTLHTERELELFLKDFNYRKNKFGGYRFSYGKWEFDIWSLQNTWAIREGLVHANNFHGLLGTTFFDIDGVAFHISERRLLSSDMHVSAVQNKVLGINLEQNPSPASMARRAVHMALHRKLDISPKLAEYILKNSDSADSDFFLSAFLQSLKRTELPTSSNFAASLQLDWVAQDSYKFGKQI